MDPMSVTATPIIHSSKSLAQGFDLSEWDLGVWGLRFSPITPLYTTPPGAPPLIKLM